MHSSATEPKVSTSNTCELSNSTGARNQRRGVSMRGIKTEYNRKHRRTVRAHATAELRDYLTHGAY